MPATFVAFLLLIGCHRSEESQARQTVDPTPSEPAPSAVAAAPSSAPVDVAPSAPPSDESSPAPPPANAAPTGKAKEKASPTARLRAPRPDSGPARTAPESAPAPTVAAAGADTTSLSDGPAPPRPTRRVMKDENPFDGMRTTAPKMTDDDPYGR